MKMVFHGGKCCGVKTIHGLGVSPSSSCDELPKVTQPDTDRFGGDVSSDKRFFADAAPEESCLKRLDRYIEYARTYRPQGILEITTAQGRCYNQTKVWSKHLLDRGFKAVTEAPNSNSGNTVTIWHKVYDVPAEKKAAAEAKHTYDERTGRRLSQAEQSAHRTFERVFGTAAKEGLTAA